MNASLSTLAGLTESLGVIRRNIAVVEMANRSRACEANRRLAAAVAAESALMIDELTCSLQTEVDRFEAAADEVPLPELEPIFKTAHVYELREQAAYAERASDDDERATYADVA